MPFYREFDRNVDVDRRTVERLLGMRQKFRDQHVPVRNLHSTLMLATWNIREFDSSKYGSRLPESYYYIAEVIDRFDLVAIQEVRNLDALDRVVRILGGYWNYLVTDVTVGTAGNQERLAFLYDGRKVRLGGLAGELVLPPRAGQPVHQLYRTPYLVGFKAGWTRFMLVTVHVRWGKDRANDPERVAEIRQLAKFLDERSRDRKTWSRNIILLGDFNIFDPGDETMAALTANGFAVPEPLMHLPGTNVAQERAYDQIAFHVDSDRLEATGRAGVLDFYDTVFRDEDEAAYLEAMGDAYTTTSSGKPRRNPTAHYRTWRTYQMSDHFPLWVELNIDYSERYLERKLAGD